MRVIKRLYSMLVHHPESDFNVGPDKGKSTPRWLLFARFDPDGPKTTSDNIAEMSRLSRFGVDCCNLYFTLTRLGFRKPRFINFHRYAGIILHHTLCYEQMFLFRFAAWLRGVAGDPPLIVMRQDENIRVDAFVDFLSGNNAKLLLTTVPERERAKVYPASKLPGLKFLPTLTAYVSDSMRDSISPTEANRIIDVSYRAAENPPWFGRLCMDKIRIAREVSNSCIRRGLRHDISTSLADRIGGDAWFAFLRRSKAVLGVESGASVFDFSGDIENRCRRFMRKNPGIDPEIVWQKLVSPHDGNVECGQIGPRHFEAAACGAAQILQEGQYSGIFHPGRHYISLKADYSNVDEALDQALDPMFRREQVKAAREEIIMNDAYHYRTFVKRFDDALESVLIK